ncbi:DUF1727 domain-containing protein [Paeniclostridium sordellii]|uniref:Mur ligase family protein n=1 Tax=Paraclostridium sordellii TaxID=1505 RepID=UPI0012AF7499|nr:Mur ligase family protein [Paeniclostridium sordellii]MDU4412277.1 MurT ligase domain-containing protein [Paeniclostridium sordellii]MRZ28356.1 DUF1727 domain-containing protein [Paeniclostridium sordellii]
MRIKIILIKLLILFLELLGKGGSLPGKLALKMDKNLFDKFNYPKNVVLITGTNGKTTINNLIFESLKKANVNIISNIKGNNLNTGIATLLCKHSDLNLNIKADVIVLEVDELTVPNLFKKLNTSVFLVSNLFRDQLDRVGEMDNIVQKFENIVKDFDGHLILNGDDPNVVKIKDSCKSNNIEFFSVYNCKESKKTSESMEGRFCPRCKERLSYDYYNYSHIGRFHCENDGFGKNSFSVFCEDIDENTNQITVNGQKLSLFKNNIYTVYNCIAVLNVLKVLDVNWNYACDVFKNFDLNQGRNEKFIKGNKYVVLNLIKNPVGTNEVLKDISRDLNLKTVLISINDNIQDGIDVSWLWDSNFEIIFKQNVDKIICSGSRGYDVGLMLKYKGYKGKLIFENNIEKAIDKIDLEKEYSYVLSNYSGLSKIRKLIERRV